MKKNEICYLMILATITILYGCSRNSTIPVPDVSPTTSNKPQSNSFFIYNQIHYNQTPTDLIAYGISSSIIHYSISFLDSVAGDPPIARPSILT